MPSSAPEWAIGMEVIVAPRTWPGINKPGGHGKVININYSSLGVVDTLDVRYTLGKTVDTNLDTELVKPHVELSRGRRSRKGRDFLADQYDPAKNPPQKQPAAVAIEDEKENQNPVPVEKSKTSTKKSTKAKDSEPTEKSTTKKSKKAKPDTKKSQREEVQVPKKKRRKPNGNAIKTTTTTKPSKSITTAPVVTEAEDYSLPEGIPRIVHPNSALAPGDLSPLGGPVTNRGTPRKYPPVSEEKPPSDVARMEERNVDEVVGKFERKTMQTIFDEQMQEAACYVDSLVGGKPTKQSVAVLSEDKPPPTVSAAPPMDEKRFAEFGKVFSNAMRYNDFIQEDELFDNVNGLCSSYDCQSFTREELKEFVGRLIAEDKVMLSDGNFYPI